MDTSTSAGKLIITLKQLLRSKGLHYRDVAARLKVSEGTVKRYFGGKGVSIDVLEKLAEIVDLDLLSAAALAQEQHQPQGGLTNPQQAALVKGKYLLPVFHSLSIGFTPAQLIQEFDIAEQMEDILTRLEELGLIRRLSRNNVKLLARPKFGGEVTGNIKEHKIDSAHQFLSEMNLQSDRCEWSYYSARLSAASAVRLRELIYRFASDVEALHKSEIALSMRETEWYRLFVATEPTSRKRLFR